MPEVPERGQQLFLSCTEVLQNVLLPLLIAVDLARMCMSCKGLRLWLLSLPSAFWTDAPMDAAPGYLATMSSTEQLLSAVRRGQTARQNIQANRHPIRTEKLQLLPAHCSQPAVRHFSCTAISCREVAFSTCGTYLSVVTQGQQDCTLEDPEPALLPPHMTTSQVTLYCTSANAWHASYSLGTATPIVRWCRDRAQLCIAQRPRQHGRWGWGGVAARDTLEVPSPHPFAFMVDGEDGAQRHVLGPEASRDLHGMDTRMGQHVSWSPDCRFLLVCWRHDRPHPVNERHPARLSIISVVQDRVVATSSLSEVAGSFPSPAVTWLPTSDGVILSSDCTLSDPAAFQTAGIAVGILPESYHAHYTGISAHARCTGFCADGTHLLAGRFEYGMSSRPVFSVLSCIRGGSDISFVFKHTFHEAPICWIPGTSSLLSQSDDHFDPSTCNVRHIVPLYAGAKEPSPLKWCPPLFSPAARFAVDGTASGASACSSIVDMHTHKQVWKSSLNSKARAKLGRDASGRPANRLGIY